jgi:hypothetical protein
MELVLVKSLLFILPLLRNLYINYLCWNGIPELQVDLETVLLSPFYNFFLIMCAVHGRLKCLLWYLPEVPPNHGMLQRCVPDNIQLIKKRAVSIYSQNMSITSGSDMSSKYENESVDVSVLKSVVSANSKAPSEGIDPYLSKSADPTLLDSFEFFSRDGTSTFVSYSENADFDDDV